MVKPRRGYGGAGVVLYDSGSDVPPNAQGLAQRYVPAHLEGRAWSLRAYLIVRADGVYLSRIGVVRFALDGSIATNAARAVLAKGAPDERSFVWARRRLPGVWDVRTWPRVRDAARGVAAERVLLCTRTSGTAADERIACAALPQHGIDSAPVAALRQHMAEVGAAQARLLARARPQPRTPPIALPPCSSKARHCAHSLCRA